MVIKSAHVLISGKVQGVGYRYSTLQQARNLGIKGWVKNLPDGRVEACFEGDSPGVEDMIQWCNIGPKAATVQNVSVKWCEPQHLPEFQIR